MTEPGVVGGAIATEIDFPAQMEDIVFGVSGNINSESVVGEGAVARWMVPSAPVPGWVEMAFDDSDALVAEGFAIGSAFPKLLEGENMLVILLLHTIRATSPITPSSGAQQFRLKVTVQ